MNSLPEGGNGPFGPSAGNGSRTCGQALSTAPVSRVCLGDFEVIAADYVVLATGSTYPFPAKSNAHDAEDAIDNYRAAYSELTHANRVLLLGAGAVGIELAGEITSKWPDKHVTILDPADDVLGERFRPELRAVPTGS
jgi:apoptosis-inducing factor 2